MAPGVTETNRPEEGHFHQEVLSPEEDESSKAFVCYCFLVFHLIGKYIFLDLFQRNQWLISRLLIFCDVLAQVIKQDNTGYTFECNNCCKT